MTKDSDRFSLNTRSFGAPTMRAASNIYWSLPFALALTAVPVAFATAQDSPVSALAVCGAIADANQRLACFDSTAKLGTSADGEIVGLQLPAGTAAEHDIALANWEVTSTKSPIDDSDTVVLATTSLEPVSGMFGQNEPAALILRCKENSTNVYFASSTMLGDSIIADSQTVTYRMDDRRAVNSNWNLSTDRKAAGLWSGQSAIPFLKQILGTRQIVPAYGPALGQPN